MKLLMIIVESEHKEELEVILGRHEVVGYTEIPQVHGHGESGFRMGSAAFPKTSSLIFTVIPASTLDELVADITRHCAACMEKMKMIVWGVEQVL